MPIHRTLNQYFFSAWSSPMAYVLGYFAADGCMYTTKKGEHFIEFTSIDRELLEVVRSAVGSNHAITQLRKRNSNQTPQFKLRIGSRQWLESLAALGFTPNKTFTLRFPHIPEEFVGSFIRGYFDGDGCVYFKLLTYANRRNPRSILLTLFTSGSQPFLSEMHKRLKLHGLKGGSLVKRGNAYDLKFSHRDSLALYRLMYNTSEVAQLFLPRKREKLKKAIQALGLEKELRS